MARPRRAHASHRARERHNAGQLIPTMAVKKSSPRRDTGTPRMYEYLLVVTSSQFTKLFDEQIGAIPWKWSIVRYSEMPKPTRDNANAANGRQRGTVAATSSSSTSTSTSRSGSSCVSTPGASCVCTSDIVSVRSAQFEGDGGLVRRGG